MVDSVGECTVRAKVCHKDHYLSDDTFTYFSEAHHTTSWLDHRVATTEGHKRIASMSINYDILSSDHFPLSVSVSIPIHLQLRQASDTRTNFVCSPNWDKATDAEIQRYTSHSDLMLSRIPFPREAMMCTDANCLNQLHREALATLYERITHVLCNSAARCIPSSQKRKYNVVPGWNELVDDAHYKARLSFKIWTRAGKPRNGDYYNEMSIDRARFKYALRNCRREEASIRADKLAKALQDKDCMQFWRDVKSQGNRKLAPADTVEGQAGGANIAALWAKHYEGIFNCVKNHGSRHSVMRHIEERCSRITSDEVTRWRFTQDNIRDNIKMLKKRKAGGLDGLYPEHIRYAGPTLAVILCMCFNCSILHNYLPRSTTDSVIIPVIKDKTGDASSKANYRPIALSSVLAKLLEISILNKTRHFLQTSDHQFGFKSSHSTDMCIYALKETIHYYLNHSSNVFACFMDASKAFDRVNYWTLFAKLCDRDFPVLYLRILVLWYTQQGVRVRWGSHTSSSFSCSNGVRQGGVLSPVLFTVYVDAITEPLKASRIGCSMANTLVNHLYYADDLVLLAPTQKGLQELINICIKYSERHDILFNTKKTVCMHFAPPSYQRVHRAPKLSLNSDVLKNVSVYKYLGVKITQDLSDDDDIAKQLRSFYVRANYVSRTFSACTSAVKIQLFNAFCCNMYAAHCWCCYKNSSFKKLTVAFNNSFRRLMSFSRSCSASAMFVLNRLPTLKEILRTSIYGFRQRLLYSSNSVMQNIVRCTYNSKLWDLWNKELFTFQN